MKEDKYLFNKVQQLSIGTQFQYIVFKSQKKRRIKLQFESNEI